MYLHNIVSTSPTELAAVKKLLNTVFPKARSENYSDEFLDWEYNQNPAGKIVGYNAWCGEIIAAHYAGLPMFAVVNGKKEKGLLSLNTATHPEHRGKRLFSRLAEKTFRYAFEKEYSFVVGVANANSTYGFVKKLGFQLICPLYTMIGKFDIRLPGPEQDLQFYRIWDRATLEWRFFRSPQAYSISCENSQFSLQSRSTVPFLDVFMGKFENRLLPGRRVSKKAFFPPLMYIGIANPEIIRRLFCLDLPARLKPSPLNLIYKDLKGRNSVFHPDRIFFQAGDFDAF
jgi:GNAT superfamily N-acetyltransferase